jgi:hypothetical protein
MTENLIVNPYDAGNETDAALKNHQFHIELLIQRVVELNERLERLEEANKEQGETIAALFDLAKPYMKKNNED